MKPEVREMLDKIEDFLMNEHGNDLAMILSALRGPDSHSDRLKESTTTFVRRKAFPVYAERNDAYGLGGAWSFQTNYNGFTMDPNELQKRGVSPDQIQTHFINHIEYAMQALDR